MLPCQEAIWVSISYNLYFAFAITIYNMSQSLMVPLSTRNTKQRDGLALLLSMGQSMLPGDLVYLVVPIVLLPFMGVDRTRWAMVMSIISVIMLPGVLLQYYFTKERVFEDVAVFTATMSSVLLTVMNGRPDGGVRRKMQSDEIRCRTVPQIFSQMGYEWGITPVIERFTKILEPANPHKHWVCKKILKKIALTS